MGWEYILPTLYLENMLYNFGKYRWVGVIFLFPLLPWLDWLFPWLSWLFPLKGFGGLVFPFTAPNFFTKTTRSSSATA